MMAAFTKTHRAFLVGSSLVLGLLFTWGTGASCARPETTTQSPGPALTNSPSDNGALNIEGVARDAKLGAVVVGEDGVTYYIAGLNEWAPELLGHKVSVSGILKIRKLAPDPIIGADGAVSAGMYGDAPVLTEATWKPAH